MYLVQAQASTSSRPGSTLQMQGAKEGSSNTARSSHARLTSSLKAHTTMMPITVTVSGPRGRMNLSLLQHRWLYMGAPGRGPGTCSARHLTSCTADKQEICNCV